MRVLGWNIRQGGGRTRTPAIADFISGLNADVVVISEFNPAVPDNVVTRLQGQYTRVPNPAGVGPSHTNLAVLTRRAHVAEGRVALRGDDAHRFLHVQLDGWNIIGCYIPGKASGQRKLDFWRHLVDVVNPAMSGLPTLIIGDLNTGLHERDELGRSFVCADDLAAFHANGWRDAWTELHPDERPPASWWSHTRNPFRLDHALLSPASPMIDDVQYVEEVAGIGQPQRPWRRLSDHAALIVDLPALRRP